MNLSEDEHNEIFDFEDTDTFLWPTAKYNERSKYNLQTGLIIMQELEDMQIPEHAEILPHEAI